MLKIVYKKISLGGAETLLKRIGSFFFNKGIDVSLYCEAVSAQEMIKEFENAKIKIHIVKNASKEVFSTISANDIIFTISLYDYIECLEQRNKSGCSNNVFYYVVHPYNPIHTSNKKIFDMICHNGYKAVLESSIIAGTMIFMDEMCTNEFNLFYGTSTKAYQRVIHLPMIIHPLDLDRMALRIQKRRKDFNILTIARADFPFKGYIKSLISFFERICKDNLNCRLTIVSSGKEISVLREWIIKSNARDKIELFEDISPSKLVEFYEDASLYLGQGTTLLEACEHGVPALPIEGYTYDLKSKGFFDEVDGCLGVPFGEGESAEPYILKILNMTDEQYKRKVLEDRKVYASKHDINIIYDYLILHRNSNHLISVPLTVVFENFMRRIVHDVKKHRIV